MRPRRDCSWCNDPTLYTLEAGAGQRTEQSSGEITLTGESAPTQHFHYTAVQMFSENSKVDVCTKPMEPMQIGCTSDRERTCTLLLCCRYPGSDTVRPHKDHRVEVGRNPAIYASLTILEALFLHSTALFLVLCT